MKNYSFKYLLPVVTFGLGSMGVLYLGTKQSNILTANPSEAPIWESFLHTLHEPAATLMLQIISILIVARILGWLMVKIGQPTVIGEIVAGIVLGASVLGNYCPEISGFLFPPSSFSALQLLSKVGLILFMFIIGMELDLEVVRKRAGEALIISHTSIVFAYFVGAILAYFLYDAFAPKDKSFLVFALFMGTSMSIAAFPVLARIIQERGLTKTPFGALIITCAAIDDITAWCLLAIVIAIAKAGGIESSFVTIALAITYLAFMWWVIRPFFERIGKKYFARETINRPIVAFVFIILFISAYLTELLGIHALIGAFIAGVVLPENKDFRHILTGKIEDLSLILLLPLFFVYTGLRTQIGLINEPHLWAICGLIVCVAIIGKFGGSFLPAYWLGISWKESLMIGTLMNTRGLMELVVLNIGYELGILSPQLFAMMVLMALSTTFMTGPVLNLIDWIFDREKHTVVLAAEGQGNILISFGAPNAGARLLDIAHQLFQPTYPKGEIVALHCTPSSDISIQEAEIFEKEGFVPILEKSAALQVPITKHYKATNQVSLEIVNFANQNPFELMLVGSSHSIFSDDKTGGKVRYFFEDVKCRVAVLMDNGFGEIQRLLFCVQREEDVFLLPYLQAFLKNAAHELIIWDKKGIISAKNKAWDFSQAQGRVKIQPQLPQESPDLALLSRPYWEQLQTEEMPLLFQCSVLVLSNKMG
ncbi:MAG: cation:proton antiporter [Bacteroidia bacterium]